jgi:hypothetical protein
MAENTHPSGVDLPLVSGEHAQSSLELQGVFSCVVDAKPRFHLEVLRWYATLTQICRVSPEDIVVNAVSGTNSDALDYLRAQGVVIDSVEPFDPRSPHCNKIMGAIGLAERGVTGVAVLTDTDVVVLEDPRVIELEASKVGFRLVGGPNPSLPILERIFGAAGLDAPPTVPIGDWRPGELTFANHGNGGLYLVPAAVLSRLANAWERWARWLLEHPDLLERSGWFLDQISFTLALAEEKIEPQRLDIRWNFPRGKATRMPTDISPAVIHYHKAVTSGGLVSKTGADATDRQIDIANAAITHVWRAAFPNASVDPVDSSEDHPESVAAEVRQPTDGPTGHSIWARAAGLVDRLPSGAYRRARNLWARARTTRNRSGNP